jgi:hypothetical protein
LTRFTYRSARSGSLVVGFSLAIVVETLVLHIWLGARHPALTWTLTAASVWALCWLAADYRALGQGTIGIDDNLVDLRVGRRAAVRVPVSAVSTVAQPTWRELPEAGASASGDYRNLMKPATPNVLVTLAAPARVRLPGGFTRMVRRLGLRLDDPEGFIAAIDAVRLSGVAEE